ncbi:MAG: hypothetical protein DSY42_01830 [Aquifex sp.]|nr:MAG: hypothetical protein DSY42_01830 [Aquifex sp.]
MFIILLFILFFQAFAVCGLNYDVEIKFKIEKKIGKKFRRADVILYVPIIYNSKYEKLKGIDLKIKTGKDNAKIIVRTKSPIKNDWILAIPFNNGYVDEVATVEKYLSSEPLIKEVLTVYPLEISSNIIKFPVPPLNPSEKLIVTVKHTGRLGNPYAEFTISNKNEGKKHEVRIVKFVYSFSFGYAKTTTRDLNLGNLKAVIGTLSTLNKIKKIEIIGIADGHSKNPVLNKEIAKKRALNIAGKLFSDRTFQCIVKRKGVVYISQ